MFTLAGAMVSESTLYRLLTFQVPNLMSHFRSLGRTGISVQVRGFCKNFVTWYVFTVRSCWHLAQPPPGGPPLVGCPRIQYIRSYMVLFYCEELLAPRTNSSWRTTSCRLSAYSIQSQLPSICETVPPSAT